MRIKIFCLPYNSQSSCFEDAELQSFCKSTAVHSIQEQFFLQQEKPFLAVSVKFTPPPCRAELDDSAELNPEEKGLFEILRKWRTEKAQKEGIPPYILLTNKQLTEIVKLRPQSKSDLLKINGIGQAKLERFGEEILSFLNLNL